jgi:dihydropyrimidinase
VLPGGVDNHTHFGLPFGGTYTRGFETTTAAIVGGTTSIVDFVPQPTGMSIHDAVEKHIREQSEGKAVVDYNLHGMVMDVTEGLFDEIPKLPEIGIPTVKLFMAYKGTPFMVDDATLFKAMKAASSAGVTIMVHAENGDLIDALQKQCLSNGQVEPKYHAVSRPPSGETEATVRAISIAELAEAPLFVVHVSTKEAMEAIREANIKGLPIYGETCPHYLTLTVDNLSKENFEGAKYVCSPALRTREHLDALWESIQKGWLQVVGSDHCGFNWKEQKHMGRDDFTKIPNGAPSVENRLAILWTYGVETGRLSKQRLVDVFSTAPAKFNGLFHRKGHVGVGYDADLVLFDPHYQGIISVRDSLQGVDYSAYEGMEQKGRPVKVFLRGSLSVDDGRFVGKPGQGQFLPGKAFGAAYTGV